MIYNTQDKTYKVYLWLVIKYAEIYVCGRVAIYLFIYLYII